MHFLPQPCDCPDGVVVKLCDFEFQVMSNVHTGSNPALMLSFTASGAVKVYLHVFRFFYKIQVQLYRQSHLACSQQLLYTTIIRVGKN